MQINSVTSTVPVSYGKLVPPTPAKPSTDEVSMSMSPETFTDLVQQASQSPEVRPDVVAAYKSMVRSGHYPAEDVIEGLMNLMGGKWASMANSAGGSTAPKKS